MFRTDLPKKEDTQRHIVDDLLSSRFVGKLLLLTMKLEEYHFNFSIYQKIRDRLMELDTPRAQSAFSNLSDHEDSALNYWVDYILNASYTLSAYLLPLLLRFGLPSHYIPSSCIIPPSSIKPESPESHYFQQRAFLLLTYGLDPSPLINTSTITEEDEPPDHIPQNWEFYTSLFESFQEGERCFQKQNTKGYEAAEGHYQELMNQLIPIVLHFKSQIQRKDDTDPDYLLYRVLHRHYYLRYAMALERRNLCKAILLCFNLDSDPHEEPNYTLAQELIDEYESLIADCNFKNEYPIPHFVNQTRGVLRQTLSTQRPTANDWMGFLASLLGINTSASYRPLPTSPPSPHSSHSHEDTHEETKKP